ncbi:probable F420-dependent oxidoreductase, Rv3093c family [Lentzea waywayandensis]|uniref:Probable F420-dependent oxidoreductase, Rv3093c family n=1 Tax=Lentzea waywayandensis TaxID=84724 RepID=A0A1I6DH59_9PSEU|nr:LLM class F420-dependent oxidoreductase [Lentzea waywayandensis]SFR04718.1 probable F420-dependent oxidoreductase, Rv3093c family [Lentzea waywayandensis]
MTSVGVVTPFWLDRPPAEALDIAVVADEAGFGTLWIGEMATFDAFALATAAGLRTSDISLKIGPLAAGVRSPVALALGLSTVVAMTGRRAGLALGASSPRIVTEWHGRDWEPVRRMRETVRDTRAILAGNRVAGFRLQQPVPGTPISVAAFGPAMTRVAAAVGDEVVLNLVSAGHVASVKKQVRELTNVPPPLAVWIPAALDPGPATLHQLRAQLSVYLSPPGYGEMFTALGHGTLVEQARAGKPRSELAQAIPADLIEAVGAIGSARDIARRVDEYFDAGAEHVGLVPATAGDPAGRELLTRLSPLLTKDRR